MSSRVKIGTKVLTQDGTFTELNSAGTVHALNLGFAATEKGLLTTLDLGLRETAGNQLPLKMDFPTELGAIIARGVTNENTLSMYSKEVDYLTGILVKLGDDELINNTDMQIAAALDRFLGGLE